MATCQARTTRLGVPCTRQAQPGQPYCYQHAPHCADGHYTDLIGVKLTEAQAAEIRRQARLDDRTISGYMRRLLDWALPLYAERLEGGKQDVQP